VAIDRDPLDCSWRQKIQMDAEADVFNAGSSSESVQQLAEKGRGEGWRRPSSCHSRPAMARLGARVVAPHRHSKTISPVNGTEGRSVCFEAAGSALTAGKSCFSPAPRPAWTCSWQGSRFRSGRSVRNPHAPTMLGAGATRHRLDAARWSTRGGALLYHVLAGGGRFKASAAGTQLTERGTPRQRRDQRRRKGTRTIIRSTRNRPHLRNEGGRVNSEGVGLSMPWRYVRIAIFFSLSAKAGRWVRSWVA